MSSRNWWMPQMQSVRPGSNSLSRTCLITRTLAGKRARRRTKRSRRKRRLNSRSPSKPMKKQKNSSKRSEISTTTEEEAIKAVETTWVRVSTLVVIAAKGASSTATSLVLTKRTPTQNLTRKEIQAARADRPKQSSCISRKEAKTSPYLWLIIERSPKSQLVVNPIRINKTSPRVAHLYLTKEKLEERLRKMKSKLAC